MHSKQYIFSFGLRNCCAKCTLKPVFDDDIGVGDFSVFGVCLKIKELLSQGLDFNMYFGHKNDGKTLIVFWLL